jgi:hypothetical protein
MDIFRRKSKKLEKARNDALHGVSCFYLPDTEERKEYNRTKQEIEDKKVERGIRTEATRMLQEWINAPTLKFGDTEFKNCILVMKPFMYAYMLHDQETAKFLNVNINELVREEYNRLKANVVRANKQKL